MDYWEGHGLPQKSNVPNYSGKWRMLHQEKSVMYIKENYREL